MLVIKQLFPIKQLFKELTLDSFNTRPRGNESAQTIRLWFKYPVLLVTDILLRFPSAITDILQYECICHIIFPCFLIHVKI